MTDTAVHPPKRADIQGLRAIAVLAVVAFHADHALIPGGFTGVDVFFVLSGFLITQVLLRPITAGRFSIADFYRRRVRRLYPALFAMLAFVLVMGLIFFPPPLLKSLVKSQFFTTLYLSNFAFARESGYFDLQAELKPLLHTWSLAVEEQFYLLYPPLLYALHRWARPLLWPALGLMALASLYVCQVNLERYPAPAFYWPVSRAMELLIGALAAGVLPRLTLNARAQSLLGGAGLIAILAGYVLIRDETPFPGLWALLPCLGTAALLLTPQGWPNRLLNATPLVCVGDVSYSLYLWHWPLLVFAGFLFPDAVWPVIAALILSGVMSWLSWRYIETPFLRHPGKPILWFALGCMAASIAACLLIYTTGGLPQRFSPQARAYLAASNDFNHDRKTCHMESNAPIPYAQTCIYGDKSAPPAYAVWGDSHGAELSRALGEKLGDYGQSLRELTMSGCPATLSRKPVCRQHNLDMMAAIKADPNMQTIILVGNLHDDDASAREATAGMEQTALALQKAGKTAILVYPIPIYNFDPPSQLALSSRAQQPPQKVGQPVSEYLARHQAIIDDFDRFTARNSIRRVEPQSLFCDDNLCHVYQPGVGVLYFNAGHLSLTGADILADGVLSQLALTPQPEK
jgi:peptidoglycan/LPS O-acetylase OafA/YrhL